MADLDLDWGGDLALTADGDLALVDGDDMVQQRIIRRLLTAVNGYVWHPEYGAGLPQRIGRVARARDIQALVRASIALEETVAKTPVPLITVNQDTTVLGLFLIGITYTDAATGTSVSLSFELPTN